MAKKMTAIEILEDQFQRLQNKNPELEKYSLVYSDQRSGDLVAIAEKYEHGAIRLKTDYLSKKEMSCFLSGFAFGKELTK